MQVAKVHVVCIVDLVVEPRDVLPPIEGARHLMGDVVACRGVRIQHRNVLHACIRPGHRSAVGHNQRCNIAVWNRLRGAWIKQVAGSTTEVAAQFGIGRNGAPHGISDAPYALVFLPAKEEDPAALEGSAEVPSKVIEPQRTLDRRKVVLGIEPVVAQKLERAAVILIAAAFGHNVDRRPRIAAKFR